MKRFGNLYGQVCAYDNILLAIRNASRDHARDPAVINMKANPDEYAGIIRDMLVNHTYKQSAYRTRVIFEHGKQRTLRYTRTFPDRVVQHCLLQIIGPILIGTYISDSYASIPNKGLHHGSVKLRSWLKIDPIGTRYCLKIDVHHYYDSIDRNILYQMLCRKLKDQAVLALLHQFIFQAPGTGIPIGNYLSQFLSNFYLTEFDHYCKQTLGLRYYMRYMDDIVVLSNSKIILRNVLRMMKSKLQTYGLTLKANYQTFPTEARGIDYIGFVFRHLYTAIRKHVKISYIRSIAAMRRRLRSGYALTNHLLMSHRSYYGILMWCDSRKLRQKYEHRLEGYIEGILV